MKNKLIFTFFLIGISKYLLAYPITPRPLRKLIVESELIVYAYVSDNKSVNSENGWSDTKAILVIEEVLQGVIKSDSIVVYFTPGMICPAPASYKKGTFVLAFLDTHKNGYMTHALSYGSKSINKEAYQVYKQRIIEMQQILEIKNKKEQNYQTLEWLVACASNKYTRWEGVYELSPRSDFMSFYDRDNETFVQRCELVERHITILRESLFETETLAYSDLGLCDIVVQKNDTELVSFLIEQLKKSDLQKYWFVDMFLSRIAEFSDRDDLRKIVKKIEEIDYFNDDKEKKTQKLVQEFIEKI